MEKRIKLNELHTCEYNPRKIKKQALDRLIDSLRTHSAAAGGTDKDIRLATTITVNRQENRIVGGHQRVEALKRMGASTISPENITWVDLPPSSPEEKALNISLNNDEAAGEFENLNLLLADIEREDEGLFDDLDLGILYQRESDQAEGRAVGAENLDTAVQLEPAREYVVVVCGKGEPGQLEFERLRELLSLGMVRRGGYARGSATDQAGVQRVVKAADFLQRFGAKKGGATC